LRLLRGVDEQQPPLDEYEREPKRLPTGISTAEKDELPNEEIQKGHLLL